MDAMLFCFGPVYLAHLKSINGNRECRARSTKHKPMDRSTDKMGYFPFEGEFPSPTRIQPKKFPWENNSAGSKRRRGKVDVHIMCSAVEREQLRTLAQRCRLSMSDYCRRAIFGKRIVERLGGGQLVAYRMLLCYFGHF